jgi:DNA-binding NtrC family response regulator
MGGTNIRLAPATFEPGDLMGNIAYPASSGAAARKRGVVLLVDDEETVRWVARRVLEADGWEVLEAADGQTALQLIGERVGRLDLVVTDLNMPGVSGRELAEVVSVFHPGLPVLAITGFLSAVNHDRRLPILPKPFTPGSLMQAVRMACGMSIRLQAPRRENRKRARKLRELTHAGPDSRVDLLKAVQALRDLPETEEEETQV